MIWTDSYKPQNTSEIQGQNKAVENLLYFVKNFKSQKKKKGLVLYGPAGSGKTSGVYAVANELDLEIIEVNASDFRNEEAINSVVGGALQQQSLFMKEKLILIDEADGIFGREDRGGVSALAKLLVNPKYPVVLTANDPWDKKFNAIRSKCEMLEFSALKYTSIMVVLKKICDKNNITYDEVALKSLARRAGGDLRAAITDLQTASIEGSITKENVDSLSIRAKTETIFKALTTILKTTDPKIARDALLQIQENPDELVLWIDENLPKEYKKPADLARAYDMVSRADVFRGRIRRRQHWRFLSVITVLLSAGVAVSKDEKYPGFTSFSRTQRLLSIWRANQKNAKKKSIAEKLAPILHDSGRDIIHNTLPYIQRIAKKDPTFLSKLAEKAGLDKDEVAWLKN